MLVMYHARLQDTVKGHRVHTRRGTQRGAHTGGYARSTQGGYPHIGVCTWRWSQRAVPEVGSFRRTVPAQTRAHQGKWNTSPAVSSLHLHTQTLTTVQIAALLDYCLVHQLLLHTTVSTYTTPVKVWHVCCWSRQDQCMQQTEQRMR